MIRQRLVSSHGHLPKLESGALTGHAQILTSYQYQPGLPLATSDLQDPVSNRISIPPSRDPGLRCCFKHTCGSSHQTPHQHRDNCHLAENIRWKHPFAETSPAASEERAFHSPPSYESPLRSHPCCTETFPLRETCMYGNVEPERGSAAAEPDERINSPSVNTWAAYPRYGVDGASYQPFTAHLSSISSVVPHTSSSIAPHDLGVYNSSTVQHGLSLLPPPSSSSSFAPGLLGSREKLLHLPQDQKKPSSPVRPPRNIVAPHPQETVSVRDVCGQYAAGWCSTGTRWTDGSP